VHLPGGTTVAAGSSVTVNLSSLDFTRDETDADLAVVSSGGVELGSAAVDTAYTPTLDEVGKASVTFVVPAGASGPTTFDVAVPSTGTTSSFTLNVTP
jgi:5'-nucleotidase